MVSPSSVRKDRERLLKKYADAGVGEYWIVDAREEDVVLEIHVLGPAGYQIQAVTDGYCDSRVFGRSFRLERSVTEEGLSQYALLQR